ncbi:MAG: maleylpyruvate isomerase N-terminal domain-containing protein [Actinomycetota bacterium]
MTLDRAWLLGVARAEREGLGRTVQYTPPDAWDNATPCAGWRVRDVLAHLAAAEVAAAAVLAGETPTEIDAYAKSLDDDNLTLDGFNDSAVRRRAETDVRSVAVEWGRAADLLLVRASKTTALDWVDRRVSWFGADLRIGDFIQMRVTEWWVHGADMLVGAAMPPRLEHPPIFCVNDLAVRLIPYALSLKGLSFPDRSLAIDLKGVGGGSWHQGMAGHYTPPEGKRADAIISGRGHAFAEVSADRVDADLCLYDGVLLLGGDVELAETVLKALRTSP